jgi:hypothetical protein
VNVDFPTRMIDRLDREAARLSVTRQSIIKTWLAERLDRTRLARECGKLNPQVEQALADEGLNEIIGA